MPKHEPAQASSNQPLGFPGSIKASSFPFYHCMAVCACLCVLNRNQKGRLVAKADVNQMVPRLRCEKGSIVFFASHKLAKKMNGKQWIALEESDRPQDLYSDLAFFRERTEGQAFRFHLERTLLQPSPRSSIDIPVAHLAPSHAS